METTTKAPRNEKLMFWAGWVLSGLATLLLVPGAIMSIAKVEMAVKGSAQYGYEEHTMVPLGLTSLICTILYLIPPTSMLGAILLTGYLGGAVATHVAAEEGFLMALIVGVFVWGGLFGREPRVRALIPIKRSV